MTREEAIRIEVVRCQDCKHCDISLVLPSGRKMYTCMEGTHDHQMLLSPNDFCSYGERRKQDVNKYGVEPYIDIGGNGEDHTCVTREWISVEDRLPEKNQAVLGWYKDNPFAGYTYGVVSWNGKGWVFVYAQRYVTNVTHWMPLPKAPETKKTKEE